MSWNANWSLPVAVRVSKTRVLKFPKNTEFKSYDATVTKTSFKIASSGLLIFSSLTFKN